MLKDIVELRPTGNYRVRLRFEDGVEGEVDVAKLVWLEGVFAPLIDREEFLKVAVNPDWRRFVGRMEPMSILMSFTQR